MTSNTCPPSLATAATTLAQSLARQAGNCIKQMRETGAFNVSLKRPRDLLTDADLEADRLIRSGILSQFPDHQILSEESSPNFPRDQMASGPLWVIDPIDGTVNYATGQLQVGISIAFFYNGSATAAAVYAPFYDEMFAAQRSLGATLNGKPIQPRNHTTLERAVVSTGFPYDRSEPSQMLARVKKVLLNLQDIRRLGSASLDVCWVACGRLDAYYENVSPWDIAAAALIAREAGARVGTLQNSPKNDGLPPELYSDQFYVASPTLYEQIYQILQT